MDLASARASGRVCAGVDLCCCNGGDALPVRFRNVASRPAWMRRPTVVERAGALPQEGLADPHPLVQADVCASAPAGRVGGFRLGRGRPLVLRRGQGKVRHRSGAHRASGGVIRVPDWVEGPAGLSDAEAERFLRFMNPDLAGHRGLRALLEQNGCEVVEASDTGRSLRTWISTFRW